jgi:DNA polymerase
MPRSAPCPLESDIAAALDWWRHAGVDATFADKPQGWLAAPAVAPPPLSPAPVQRSIEAPPLPPARQVGGGRELWPQDLPTFRQWWLNDPSLDDGGLAPRVAPAGEVEAGLMILVAMPEETDRETLLSGSQGRLLDGFLQAAGFARGAVYRASVLPRHTPLPDWSGLAEDGMSGLVAHHVALVRPARLLILGRNILPLCGHDPAQGAAALTFFNHEGGRVPALAEAGLERLLGNPALRARLWKRWLDWTNE